MRSHAFALAGFVVLAACAPESDRSSELLGPSHSRQANEQAGDRYVVVLDRGTSDAVVDDIVRQHGASVQFRYRYALTGFAATIPAAAVDGLRRNPNVVLVEPDGIATASTIQTSPPSWGLDRIDQRGLPLSNSYEYQNEGQGVRAYILDTGIRFDHQEFGGRATSGYDFVDNDANAADCHGHGTHVAGTVGGTTVGVAKSVSLIAVRVLGCSGSGSYAGIIAAIDWVTANHIKPAVVNMSLGGGYYAPLNTAIANSVAAGVVYAVAAGNENTDACSRSPASAPAALTIAASTGSDARASFSNYGTCVDIFAPGQGITSSTQTGTNTYASWNGTSMASPHVAGVAALFLAANPTATPSQVETAIETGATSGVITGVTGSPNLLLYGLIASGTVPPPPPPPPTTVVHVSDLAGSSVASGKKGWKATVTVTVVDAGGAPVAGALVNGSWTGGVTGTASCTTGAAGTCSVTTGTINFRKTSVTLTVSGITGSGLSYNSAANAESSITVTSP